MKRFYFLLAGLLLSVAFYGQDNKWLNDKPGSWRFKNPPGNSCSLRNGTLSAADNTAFKKNMATLAEWHMQLKSEIAELFTAMVQTCITS